MRRYTNKVKSSNMSNRMSGQTIAIVVLSMMLIMVVGYLGFTAYKEAKVTGDQRLIQQGLVTGYEQAVVQLLQQASTCQVVPVRYQNLTLNLVAVECLEALQNQQAAQMQQGQPQVIQ